MNRINLPMKIFGLTATLALFLIFPAFTLGEGPRWVGGLAPMGDPRQEVAVVGLGGKVYAIGGLRQDGSETNSMEVYNPNTNTWAVVGGVPMRGANIALATANGKLYAMGGLPAIDGVFEYDPETELWTARAVLPFPRGGFGAAAIAGRIYTVGGVNPSGSLRDLLVYDPSSDSWSQLTSMPTARSNMAVGAIDGKLYVVGGRDNEDRTIAVVEVYDPETDSWTRPSVMPTGRSNAGFAVYEDELYVFGGDGNRGNPSGVFAVTEIYNPALNQWRTGPPMPTPRHGTGAAIVGSKMYLPGGASRGGFEISRAHEVFLADTLDLYFPHIPAGGGLSTEITLINPSQTERVIGALDLFDRNGAPVAFDINGQIQSTIPFVIPPHGSATFRAEAPASDPISVIYAVASPSNPLNGSVIFRSGPSVAGVASGTAIQRFIMPVQVNEAAQTDTGLALLNLDSEPATVTLVLNNERGQMVESTEVTLEARHQIARFVTEFFPDVDLATFRGTLVGSCPTNISAVPMLIVGSQLTSLPLGGGQ